MGLRRIKKQRVVEEDYNEMRCDSCNVELDDDTGQKLAAIFQDREDFHSISDRTLIFCATCRPYARARLVELKNPIEQCQPKPP